MARFSDYGKPSLDDVMPERELYARLKNDPQQKPDPQLGSRRAASEGPQVEHVPMDLKMPGGTLRLTGCSIDQPRGGHIDHFIVDDPISAEHKVISPLVAQDYQAPHYPDVWDEWALKMARMVGFTYDIAKAITAWARGKHGRYPIDLTYEAGKLILTTSSLISDAKMGTEFRPYSLPLHGPEDWTKTLEDTYRDHCECLDAQEGNCRV